MISQTVFALKRRSICSLPRSTVCVCVCESQSRDVQTSELQATGAFKSGLGCELHILTHPDILLISLSPIFQRSAHGSGSDRTEWRPLTALSDETEDEAAHCLAVHLLFRHVFARACRIKTVGMERMAQGQRHSQRPAPRLASDGSSCDSTHTTASGICKCQELPNHCPLDD